MVQGFRGPAAAAAGNEEACVRARSFVVMTVVLLLAQQASAQGTKDPGGIADRSVHDTRPMSISAMLYLPWYYGVGIGVNARFEIPIIKDGFIPQINDQVSIEPSLSLGYRARAYGWSDDRLKFFDIVPAAYFMWSFHITSKFRPYGAIGLGYDVGIWLDDENDYPGNDVSGGFFYWDTAVGMFYDFSESAAFRCEIGAQGPKAGLSVLF
jgi:hypothetical protein